MNTERRNSLMVVGYFAIGLFGGWLIGSIKPINGLKPTHIKAEYYLELQGDNAIVEGIDGYTYECPIDSIPVVLDRDNL